MIKRKKEKENRRERVDRNPGNIIYKSAKKKKAIKFFDGKKDDFLPSS